MPNWKSQVALTNEPLAIPPNEWEKSAGAVVDFWGVVRDLEGGRRISGIEYEAHAAMAQHQLEQIAEEARERFPLEKLILRHRLGFVGTGEASLFLRVICGHRAKAFAASQWIVDELKKKVPIWKRPLFVRRVAEETDSPRHPERCAAESRDPVAEASR